MALHIKHYPEDYRTVYNPIETVLFETNTTPRGYTGFAYLIDVYRGSAAAANLIGRLKVPPTTDGYGRFDLSGIMESYLSSSLGTLNGSNINEYLHEAHRVLRLDGKINIIEATSRFKDIEQFKVQLQEFGFDNVVSKGMWIFTHIVAEKSDRTVNEKAKISF